MEPIIDTAERGTKNENELLGKHMDLCKQMDPR